MAYNSKAIKVDVNAKPIPQYFNPVTDEYEVLQGTGGAARQVLYGPDGQPISTTEGKLAVKAEELETLLTALTGKDFATQATLAQILEKMIAAPATEAKQDSLATLVGAIEGKLDGDKIRKATSEDDYILGIVSANPSVIGDSHQDDWHGKYERDDWGRIQYHYVDVSAEVDDEGNEISPARKDYVAKLNPDWDNEVEYIPREKRKEWSAVGMMGKLLVRDDGSCVVNGYCKPNDSGIAVVADEGYRVMKRVREDIVQILIKGG